MDAVGSEKLLVQISGRCEHATEYLRMVHLDPDTLHIKNCAVLSDQTFDCSI
jgi:hypothetical protein